MRQSDRRRRALVDFHAASSFAFGDRLSPSRPTPLLRRRRTSLAPPIHFVFDLWRSVDSRARFVDSRYARHAADSLLATLAPLGLQMGRLTFGTDGPLAPAPPRLTWHAAMIHLNAEQNCQIFSRSIFPKQFRRA